MMEVIDLTMRVSPVTKVFPGSPQPTFVAWSRFDVHGYDSEVVHMSTHTGTHMDAPSHFAPGKQAIDGISASRLVSQAVLIKVPKKADQLIEIADISEEVRQGDTVVFATGWERQYKNSHYMTKNPGLSGKAAAYLAKNKVNAVAIDGPSIDAGFDGKFTAHNILLQAGVLAVENLCNLDKIGKKKRFTLVVAPLKLAGASGSPVRALALLLP
ncbi:cyclase family protein [Nitrososphaera viennensis]|uniref:Cyclase family protein n=2 Tax=Nitrososphaera viennensis TaxID=1034015 RepID=A0A977NNL1_9ARCH|nr:cyclase family protein [Nitrososphaera viennensis]UVS70656.1 cyclase family protein [Nitrososphaera viennensis]